MARFVTTTLLFAALTTLGGRVQAEDNFDRDIHVSYAVTTAIPGSLQLHYATGAFGALAAEEVDLLLAAHPRSSLALDRDDGPHLAYPQDGILVHAAKNRGSWTSEVASTRPVNPGREVAVAVDSNLRLAASHMRDDSYQTYFWPPFAGARELVVSMGATSGWADTATWFLGDEHVMPSVLDTSVAFDRRDRGHLGYVTTRGMLSGTSLLYTAEDRGGAWTLPEPIVVPKAPWDPFGPLAVGRAQIALESSGAWHMIYTTWEVVPGPAPYKCFIKHVTGGAGAPVHTTLAALTEDFAPPSPGEPGWLALCAEPPRNRPAITVDDNDVVHMAYWDNGHPPLFEDAGLWYARLEGGGWQKELVDPIAAPDHVSIAVNHRGEPVIAYRDDARGTPEQVKLAVKVGREPWAFTHVADDNHLAELGDVAVTGSRGRSNR